MPLRNSSELWKQGDLEEAQGLVDAQLSGAEEEEEGEEEAPPPPSPPSPPDPLSHLFLSSSSSSSSSSSFSSSSSSSSPSLSFCGMVCGAPEEGCAAAGALSAPQSSQSADPSPSGGAAGGLGQPEPPGPSGPGEAGDEELLVEGSFRMKTAALVVFLLLKYRTKEPISKAEMLEVFSPEYQDDFPAILSQASICLRLVFGLDVIEVDPSEHSYVLNPILGLTWDGMLSDQWGIPKTSLLGLILGFILLQDGCVLEEEVWETLGFTAVYDGQENTIYGEPVDRLTNVWVQEGYLERRQVAGSDPARNEFLWGPRAYEETSKVQVMDFLLQIGSNNLGSSLVL
ncbi:melanoma-associated antigen 1-like [Canis lupus baileyi]|uniref:melanoma-associated antigen 10-like n=1 Tax=Canis lupus familiaris TaxID=9615 RepID=UPI0018F577CA|nr:melanoma-associated antigen 10-like [Canis lupus familiaris]XP_038444440.1 melanoma-associated antigen 10-like [Canis lupus familiaris]XP_038444441.1 melanoma-associated antigen 10-like [Canis lupus familiaris]XP_038444442.1 melanoma-associated antigen 10-like [Canis lupus familiaris]